MLIDCTLFVEKLRRQAESAYRGLVDFSPKGSMLWSVFRHRARQIANREDEREARSACDVEGRRLVRIAVSACLLGETCRYDGASKPCDQVISLAEQHEVLPICPEVAGGLSTPRMPSEIILEAGKRRVVNSAGEDVSAQFEAGAVRTVQSMREFGCELAILKTKSPSCGSGLIYDGSFSGKLTGGWGIAAEAIRDAGFSVYDETSAADLLS